METRPHLLQEKNDFRVKKINLVMKKVESLTACRTEKIAKSRNDHKNQLKVC